jgi:hypothetical protein
VSKRESERERESSINQISFHESSSVSAPRAPQLKCLMDLEERFFGRFKSGSLVLYSYGIAERTLYSLFYKCAILSP